MFTVVHWHVKGTVLRTKQGVRLSTFNFSFRRMFLNDPTSLFLHTAYNKFNISSPIINTSACINYEETHESTDK